MSLHARLSAQHLPNYSNANDITNDLDALNFEEGLSDFERPYARLRTRHHAMTLLSVSHATYLVSALNKVRQLIAEQRDEDSKGGKRVEFCEESRARDPIKVGIIGCGRLGKQLVSALLYFADVRPTELFISTRQPHLLENLEQIGIKCVHDNASVASDCDLLFLCFSPASLVSVVEDIAGRVSQHTLIYSFLSAISLDRLRAMLKHNHVTRIQLNWDPKNHAAQWKIGNDVITSLLDCDTLAKCCPTSNADPSSFVVNPPVKTAEVAILHTINMLVRMGIAPNDIMKWISCTFLDVNMTLKWSDILDSQQLASLKANGYPPEFNIYEISSTGDDSSKLGDLATNHSRFRKNFSSKFMAAFSCLYHKVD